MSQVASVPAPHVYVRHLAQPAADRIGAGLHPGLCDLHLGVGQIERSAKLRQHSTGVIRSHS